MVEAQQRARLAGDAGDEPLQLEDAIAEFIPGVSLYRRTFFKRDLPEQDKISLCTLLEAWNRHLQEGQGGQHMDALVSRAILPDIQEFISSPLNPSGANEEWFERWLARWNDFLLARQGEPPVTKCGVLWTALGLVLYAGDMASDWGTAVYFACTEHWWQFALTLCIVYAAVAMNTVYKLLVGAVLWTGPLGALQYWVSLLVSWPDLRLCWALLHAECELARSPKSSAHLVPVWQHSRVRVAVVKLVEGVCEACPQALLQLVLLLPELQGDITWTVSVRMLATAMSLCAAGAALVNTERVNRFQDHVALPLGELAVLHVCAVPMSVCRLLCLALLLSMHLYGGLAYMALHLALYWAYWCSAEGVPRTIMANFDLLLYDVMFLVSPFDDFTPRPSFAVRHVVHFLGNAGMTMLWALTTPLHCTQPALYAALIGTVVVTFVTGLVGWLLHEFYYKRVST